MTTERLGTGLLAAAITDAALALAAAGIESARWDAEQLAAHALGVARGDLLTAELTPDAGRRLADLVAQRAARVPLQHLVGSVGFRHIDLEVGSGVFIPRPETEVVVGWVVDAVRAAALPHVRIVDLCSGSGAIPLALAYELANAEIHGVELDERALRWARRNAAARAAAGDQVIALHHGDVASALPELDGSVDVVVSNPPYVAEHELDLVDPEVRDHDPRVALVAGPDGLDVIRAVATRAAALLKPGGLLVVEHSDRQGQSVPGLLRAAGWRDVADHPDLTGRDRFATARWPG